MAEAVPPLGRLTRVDPRDVWGSEAGYFTPWLAQEYNLRLLGETKCGYWEFATSPHDRWSPPRMKIRYFQVSICADAV
jgi:hypothetical protein